MYSPYSYLALGQDALWNSIRSPQNYERYGNESRWVCHFLPKWFPRADRRERHQSQQALAWIAIVVSKLLENISSFQDQPRGPIRWSDCGDIWVEWAPCLPYLCHPGKPTLPHRSPPSIAIWASKLSPEGIKALLDMNLGKGWVGSEWMSLQACTILVLLAGYHLTVWYWNLRKIFLINGVYHDRTNEAY